MKRTQRPSSAYELVWEPSGVLPDQQVEDDDALLFTAAAAVGKASAPEGASATPLNLTADGGAPPEHSWWDAAQLSPLLDLQQLDLRASQEAPDAGLHLQRPLAQTPKTAQRALQGTPSDRLLPSPFVCSWAHLVSPPAHGGAGPASGASVRRCLDPAAASPPPAASRMQHPAPTALPVANLSTVSQLQLALAFLGLLRPPAAAPTTAPTAPTTQPAPTNAMRRRVPQLPAPAVQTQAQQLPALPRVRQQRALSADFEWTDGDEGAGGGDGGSSSRVPRWVVGLAAKGACCPYMAKELARWLT